MAPIILAQRREQERAKSAALIAGPEEPIERKSIEELKARCGDNWGISQPKELSTPKKRERTLEELEAMRDAPMSIGPSLMKKLEEYRRGEG